MTTDAQRTVYNKGYIDALEASLPATFARFGSAARAVRPARAIVRPVVDTTSRMVRISSANAQLFGITNDTGVTITMTVDGTPLTVLDGETKTVRSKAAVYLQSASGAVYPTVYSEVLS